MLLMLADEDGKKDQFNWFQPKIEHFKQFMFNVKKWISTTNKGNGSYEHEPQDEDDDGIKPSDSVSEVMTRRDKSKSESVTNSVSSEASSTNSARVKAEVKRAALLAQASALRTKQELEAEELRLKAKKEQLELDTEIAASNAELKVLKEYESQDGMNDYYRSQTGSQAGDSFKGRKERQVQPVSNLFRKSEPMSSIRD